MNVRQTVRSASRPTVITSMITAATLLASPVAYAADWYNTETGNTFNNSFSALMDSMILHRGQEQALAQSFRERESKDAALVPAQSGPVTTEHKLLSATDFRPARRGHPTADALVGSIQDPTRRNQLALAVALTFGQMAKWRANNLATALAVMIGTARELVDDADMSDQAFDDLRLAVNDAVAGAAAFAKLPRAQKQALYEYLVFHSTVLVLAREAGKSDPEAKASGVELANTLLAQFGGAADPR